MERLADWQAGTAGDDNPSKSGSSSRYDTHNPVLLRHAATGQTAFVPAHLDPLRALPILRVPATGREPELNERQLDAKRRAHEALEALGGLFSPAGSCVWHAVGLQRSVREWAIREGWNGRSLRQEQARGILVVPLAMLAGHLNCQGVA